MDASELEEIAFHRQHGRPETTRGPYYHKTWWESYKGAVKGILGGIAVGGMVGVLAGGAIVGAIGIAGAVAGASVLSGGVVGTILAATTLFGMYEGKDKFEKVGITTGAVAAAQEISEVRMKEYMRDKLTELTNEVRELKRAVADPEQAKNMHIYPVREDIAPIFDESDFRSTHREGEDPTTKNNLIYWNVAGIGATVGAAVMAVAVFAAGGSGSELLHPLHEMLGATGANAALSTGAANGILVASGAAFGGSFGVSRDLFRKIFDITDCLFMGVISGKCANEEIAQAKGVDFSPLPPHQPHQLEERLKMQQSLQAAPAQEAAGLAPATQRMETQQASPSPIIDHMLISQPQSTYFQDKPSPEVTKMAILGMDHTTARMH